ncbi:uncharacterized protein N0V96_009309 [Colletotrichum fioriniae]|uniref:uncharacterized protein n=1 Tax=Colletotrichum fioriniae TaxID=710243 RepID=UPI0032DA34DD|nr:hypothetical protein N0V96_009309 [Colletotrichum fioriniae]
MRLLLPATQSVLSPPVLSRLDLLLQAFAPAVLPERRTPPAFLLRALLPAMPLRPPATLAAPSLLPQAPSLLALPVWSEAFRSSSFWCPFFGCPALWSSPSGAPAPTGNARRAESAPRPSPLASLDLPFRSSPQRPSSLRCSSFWCSPSGAPKPTNAKRADESAPAGPKAYRSPPSGVKPSGPLLPALLPAPLPPVPLLLVLPLLLAMLAALRTPLLPALSPLALLLPVLPLRRAFRTPPPKPSGAQAEGAAPSGTLP